MPAIASSPDPANDQATRRLVTGLVLSLLAHAVLLSLRFHVPEAGMAAVTRLMVRLAPTPSAVPPAPPVQDTVVAARVEPAPAAALPPVPVSGFTVVPPRPKPVAAPAVRKPARAKARRSAPKPAKRPKLALKERIITQDINKDSEFAVPQPVLEDLKADSLAVREGTEQGTGTAAGKVDADSTMGNDEQVKPVQASVPVITDARQDEAAIALAREKKARQDAAAAAQAAEQQAERQRLAAREAERLAAEVQRREAEVAARVQAEQAQRAADEAQQRERALAVQRRAEEDARRQADIAAQERQRIADAQARQQAEEVARQQAERLAQQQAAEQARQQAERLAQQQRAEQTRQQAEHLAQQQAAEQARQQAQRLAQQQAAAQARQQAERLAQQQAAEQARQQAERLAQEQAAEQARQQAERLAQQQAAEQARADRERAAAEALRQGALAGNGSGTAGVGQGAIGGPGGAGKSAGGMPGANLGSRARELLRGLDVLGASPPAARQADAEPAARRRVSNGVERDVPLRLYVDSFRQKIERNGLLNGAQLSAGRVRIDPIVSVAIRSDGSVESVIIVRSSGHADIDTAVRRIVRLNERYGVFPPNVAVQFDVIEIRRIWTFAEGLKLIEEVR